MPVIATTLCRKLEDYRQAVLHTGGEVRVVDASILPDIPSVPTNVTTIMMAERIAAKLSA